MFSITSPRTAFLQTRHELTDADLLKQAPSIFAGQAMAGVSDRYTFLPTAHVKLGGKRPIEVAVTELGAHGAASS